jgi:hypothetical protein
MHANAIAENIHYHTYNSANEHIYAMRKSDGKHKQYKHIHEWMAYTPQLQLVKEENLQQHY